MRSNGVSTQESVYKKELSLFFFKLHFTFTICKYPLIHLVFTEKHREVFANLPTNYVNSLI